VSVRGWWSAGKENAHSVKASSHSPYVLPNGWDCGGSTPELGLSKGVTPPGGEEAAEPEGGVVPCVAPTPLAVPVGAIAVGGADVSLGDTEVCVRTKPSAVKPNNPPRNRASPNPSGRPNRLLGNERSSRISSAGQ
jgi:hypothetical protein